MNHLKNFFLKSEKEAEETNTFKDGFMAAICLVALIIVILQLIEIIELWIT